MGLTTAEEGPELTALYTNIGLQYIKLRKKANLQIVNRRSVNRLLDADALIINNAKPIHIKHALVTHKLKSANCQFSHIHFSLVSVQIPIPCKQKFKNAQNFLRCKTPLSKIQPNSAPQYW